MGAQAWMPPILALFGSLMVVSFTAWLNTPAVSAQIDALRGEMKGQIDALRAEMGQGFADLELRLTMLISNLAHRVERLEEQRGGLVRP